jgi:hypothetical protein
MSSSGLNMTDIYVPYHALKQPSISYTEANLATAQTFDPQRGIFEIICTDDTTDYEWSFVVEGGRVLTLPDALFHFLPAYVKRCTVVESKTNTYESTFTITTPAADAGGRTYVIVMNGARNVTPTIQKTLGAALGSTLTIRSRLYYL